MVIAFEIISGVGLSNSVRIITDKDTYDGFVFVVSGTIDSKLDIGSDGVPSNDTKYILGRLLRGP